MEKAIALDPGFAMAYRKMATAYGNMGKPGERAMYLQKALELSDRLTERERLLIQGSIFMTSDSTLDKAIEAYKKLRPLPRLPEAIAANNNLGEIYRLEKIGIRPSSTMKRRQKRARNSGLSTDLGSGYMAKGDYGKAEKVLEDAISGFPIIYLGIGTWRDSTLFRADSTLP